MQGHDPNVAFKSVPSCIEVAIICMEMAVTTPRALNLIEFLGHEERMTVGALEVLDASSTMACFGRMPVV